MLYAFLLRATRPTHPIVLDIPTQIIFGEEHKSEIIWREGQNIQRFKL